MAYDLENLNTEELQVLLIAKNKEFTHAIRSRTPHREMIPLYDSLKELYSALSMRYATLAMERERKVA